MVWVTRHLGLGFSRLIDSEQELPMQYSWSSLRQWQDQGEDVVSLEFGEIFLGTCRFLSDCRGLIRLVQCTLY